MKYCIWIIPPDPIYSQIKKAIENLSAEYEGPRFEPHATLLTDIERDLPELERKVEKLATGLTKFEVSLGPVSFSTTYHQSVFVQIIPTAQLMRLNLDAKKLLDKENNVFMPHLSLLYGNHNMITREKAAASVELPSASFVVDKLVIAPAASSQSDPDKWPHLATIPFKGP